MVYCDFLENYTDVSIKEIHVFTYLPLLASFKYLRYIRYILLLGIIRQ